MATSSSSSPAVSVIIPTRDRRALWESGPLLPSLLGQSDTDLELVIAVDHAQDGTLDHLVRRFTFSPPPFPVALLDVNAECPKPCPASGVPDNCAIHAARGSIVLHLDDDLDVDRDLVSYIKTLPLGLPAVVWGTLVFCDFDWQRLPGWEGLDPRPATLARYQPRAATLPSLMQIPRNRELHWGAAWATLRESLLAIGGHALDSCGFHNTDTRLGHRLARFGQSFLATDPRFTVKHYGRTWCQVRRLTDPRAVAASRAVPFSARPVANGGRDFWTSHWFDSAYHVHRRFGPAA